MVQPIGQQQTYSDMIRNAATAAFNTLSRTDEEGVLEHNTNMRVFFHEGKKNPVIAKMILHDVIREGQKKQVDELKKSTFNVVIGSKLSGLRRQALKYRPVQLMLEGKYNRYVAEEKEFANTVRDTKDNLDAFLMTGKAKQTDMGCSLTEDVKPFQASFNKEFNELYPRTGRIREKLIRERGVTYSSPTAPKRSIYQKILLSEPEEGYKKIYPNTYETRVRLLANNRLGQKGKMSPLKKMLWNMSAIRKMDIKKGVEKFLHFV